MESAFVYASGATLNWSLAALAVYSILKAIFNVFFHPLRHYPGPLLYRASRLPRAWRIYRARWPHDLVTLSNKYGPVVRVAPNELIYSDPDAWKDIMGHQNGAAVKGEEFSKDLHFYGGYKTRPNILFENRENHSKLRRQVSHGFSEKSLREQESIIKGYVDLFIQRIMERCVASDADGVPTKTVFDMRQWFNFVTFDVIGDLSFGEPFGCLEKGETVPLVQIIERGLSMTRTTYLIKEFGLQKLTMSLKVKAANFREYLMVQMRHVLERRLALNVERPDLIEGFLRVKDKMNISMDKLQANSMLLILAGSETTSTLLTGTLYLLVSNPDTFQKLKDEIRSTFKSEDEITFATVDHLPYMLAVFQEGLRHYPPVAGELPRIVPQGGGTVAGRFVPEGTTVAPAVYAMNHVDANFADPYAFRPERWLEPAKFPHDRLDAVQPFSVGPRKCVGKNLAYAEMRAIMVRLVWSFDLELVDDVGDWLDQKGFLVWDKSVLNVNLTPVERA